MKVIVGVPPQLSDDDGLPVFCGKVLLWKFMVVLAGHVIVGGVLSNTTITCVQVAELPQASVARYVLVSVYLLVQVWFEVISLTNVTVGAPPQLSVEVTLAGFGAGTCEAHCTETPAGHVKVGTVLSKTVMICVQVAELPQSSVAL